MQFTIVAVKLFVVVVVVAEKLFVVVVAVKLFVVVVVWCKIVCCCLL